MGKIAPILLFGEIRRAAAATNDNAPGLFFFETEAQPTDTRPTQRFLGRDAQQRHRAADSPRLLLGQGSRGRKAFHFGGNAALEILRVEQGNRAHAADTVKQRDPISVSADAVRRHSSEPGDDYPAARRTIVVRLHLDSSERK